MRWLLALMIVAGCKKHTPPAVEVTADAAPAAVAQAEQPSEEPSAEKTPLYDAAPPPPEAPEARKLVAPVYDWARACFKEHPAADDEKPPYTILMTAAPNGVISRVTVDGRPSASECVADAVRQKLRLRPWTGNAMEIRLPVTAAGDPVYIDAGSAPR